MHIHNSKFGEIKDVKIIINIKPIDLLDIVIIICYNPPVLNKALVKTLEVYTFGQGISYFSNLLSPLYC